MFTLFSPTLFNYIASMEGTVFKTGLFNALIECIAKLRKSNTYTTQSIIESGINETINSFTQMRIMFHVDAKYSEAAFITWPSIDKNHPFIANEIRTLVQSDTGLTLIRALGGSMHGSIDMRNCRVDGIFKEIQGDITFGAGLLRSNRFSDAELAAIMLHEIGHLWTYFVYTGTIVLTSHVISAAAKAVYELEDTDKRVIILKEAEQVLGVEIDNHERIAAMPKQIRALATESVFISAKAIQSQSETGCSIYEMRSVEQLADRFATQHGAGPDLATGLDKLFRGYMHRSTLSTTEHTMLEIGKLILFTGGLFLFPVPLLMAVLFSNPMEKRYDDPEQRIKLIKQMIIDELKEDRIPIDRRKQLQDDIELLEVVEKGLNDKRTLLELFWTTIMPGGRAALRQEQAQKKIEELLNNELFVISNKLKIGAY